MQKGRGRQAKGYNAKTKLWEHSSKDSIWVYDAQAVSTNNGSRTSTRPHPKRGIYVKKAV